MSHFLSRCERIFVLDHLEFLESLRESLCHLHIFLQAICSALVLVVPDVSRSEVGYTVDKADFRQFVVRLKKVFELRKKENLFYYPI